jgi:hypothetical protein
VRRSRHDLRPVSNAALLRTPLLTGLLCLLVGAPQLAQAGCRIVDLMPAFWRSLAADDAPAAVRAKVLDAHPDLYNRDYVSLPADRKEWETTLQQERAYVESHRNEVSAAEQYLLAHVPRYMEEFRQTFPDYRCDYVFYVAPSFNRMDGAAAFVHGQHRIVFAPDVIARVHKLSDLKVLIDHETFHIYHHQATGEFGASAEAVPPTVVALWGEGLATFVSWRMNPEVMLDSALLQPGIPEGARIHLADIAKDLLAHLDDKDPNTFAHYFVAGRQPDGYPPRAGYYVGVLLAQSLSKRYTLQQLAKLHGPPLHQALSLELRRIADDTQTPAPPDRAAHVSH